MSLLKAFYNPDRSKKEEPVKKNPVPSVKATIIQAGPIDQDFIDYFEHVMEQANLPGPDYYEFHKGILGMIDMPLPEQTKFQTSFATLKAQGITKDKLTASATTYIGVIEQEANRFETELQKKETIEVQAKKQGSAALLNKNKELQLQIEKLSREMTENLTKSNQLEKEAQDAQLSIQNKRNSFTLALEKKKEEIKEDIRKIQTYLV